MAIQVIRPVERPPACFGSSIFLAGPNPRGGHPRSWRLDAIDTLDRLGFDGVVYVPESDLDRSATFDLQADWEDHGLATADVIVVWMPRDLALLPGFTTNAEFGAWMRSGRVVFGAPPRAPKTRYLHYWARRLGIPVGSTLDETLRLAVHRCGCRAERTGGERNIPQLVWNTEAFKNWYRRLREGGHRLIGGDVEWVLRGTSPLCWVLRPTIRTADGLTRAAEVVVGRPDIAALVAFTPAADPMSTRIVTASEFTSAQGEIRQLPGGSTTEVGISAAETAAAEAWEEVGLVLPLPRLRTHSARAVAPTLASHRASLVSVELSPAEMDTVAAAAGCARGNEHEGERVYPEVMTLRDLLADPRTDWVTIGLVLTALRERTIVP